MLVQLVHVDKLVLLDLLDFFEQSLAALLDVRGVVDLLVLAVRHRISLELLLPLLFELLLDLGNLGLQRRALSLS